MPILIHSQHFHDAEGRHAFPSLMEEAHRLVSGFDGFIALRRLVPTGSEAADECHLQVEFADERTWSAWVASDQHDIIAAKMQRHWTRDPLVRVFNVD